MPPVTAQALLLLDADLPADLPVSQDLPAVLAEIEAALAAWRAAGAPVIHLARLSAAEPLAAPPLSVERPQLLARADEWLVWRRAPSAFADGGLRRLLATAGIGRLALCGCPSAEALAASRRDAAALGHSLELLPGACTGAEPARTAA